MIAMERWLPVDGLTPEPNALAAATEIARNLRPHRWSRRWQD